MRINFLFVGVENMVNARISHKIIDKLSTTWMYFYTRTADHDDSVHCENKRFFLTKNSHCNPKEVNTMASHHRV